MDLPALTGGKKRSMGEKQALAAIGQGRLIALWDQLFGMLKQPIAQILITRNDIADVSPFIPLPFSRYFRWNQSNEHCNDGRDRDT